MERESWEVLSLPAIAIEDERCLIEGPYGTREYCRAAGEALHPERESLDTLGNSPDRRRVQLSEPVPAETNLLWMGGMIKREWLRYYEPDQLPEAFPLIPCKAGIRPTAAENSTTTAFAPPGALRPALLPAGCFSPAPQLPRLETRCDRSNPRRHNPTRILIEEKSSGISLLQDLAADGVFAVDPYKPPPGSDKQMRLGAQSIKFEQGKAFLPTEAFWLDEYVLEITGFPGGKYDDQVDSTSQALDYLGGEGHTMAIWEALGRLCPPLVFEIS